MIRIPTQFPWAQTNRSDVLGSLQGTFNIDFTTNLNKVRATRMLKNTTFSSNNPEAPVGFKYFDTLIWTVAGNRVYSSADTKTAFTLNADSGTPTDCALSVSDIETFNGKLYVTGPSSLYKKVANASGTGAWSTNGTSLNSGAHLMCVYGDRLYITDSNYKIFSMSTADSIATSSTYTITFTDTNIAITFIKPASNRIWIGTVNTNNGKALIHEWDGTSSQVTRSYRLESFGAVSCVIKDDIPYVMDVNGKLLVYSSGTFKEIARLPIKSTKYLGATSPNTTGNSRFVHPNGMTLVDGRVNVLVNNIVYDSGATIPEFLPSGIWEYDENIGLYHKYSLSYTPIGTTTVTDFGQNRLSTVGGLVDMKTGDNSSTANGTLLAGAAIYTNASTITPAAFINDTIESATSGTQKSCYFVTTKIQSNNNIQDFFKKIYVKHRQFLASTNKIVAKYRRTESDPTEISITWVDTDTFTTTTNVLGKEGYEVEVIQGTGSGRVAHITTIDVTGSTYTVNLDDTFTGVTTGTAKARLQNWTKIPIEATDQVTQFKEFSVGKEGTWIQFKIWMLGTTNDEIEELAVVNEAFKKIE